MSKVPVNRLTISMPEQMNAWVEAQIKAGRYGNVSEYFRNLVRRDQDRRDATAEELRTMLAQNGAPGTARVVTSKTNLLSALAGMDPLGEEDAFPDLDATLPPARGVDL